MKPFITLCSAVLAFSSFTVAQESQADKPGQPGSTAQQEQGQQQQQPQFPAGTKTNPAPKSKEEADAYMAATQITDATALEAAANDFAAKYPDSQFKGPLFQRAMLTYLQAGNTDKATEAGRRALTFDPDDPLTLAQMATVLAERTKASDLDKEERWTDATRFASEALKNAEEPRVSASAPPEAVANLKNQIREWAYTALGTIAFNRKDFAAAEQNFLKGAQVNAAQPDPATYFRIAAAQRNQGKYEAALQSINKTLQVAQASQDSAMASMAQQQKADLERIIAQKGGAKPAGTGTPAATPATQGPATQPAPTAPTTQSAPTPR